MDTTTAAVIIVLALIVFAALMLSSNVRARIKGLFGLEAELDASKNPPPPAIKAKNIKSKKGGLLADAEGNIDAEDVDVNDDVILSSKKPADPKANPPA